ncbi:UDP-N-acetylmuramate--L-alanine ligase [Patescibacteria group bacterium]
MKMHFIGIGGIGISALAKYYLEKDCQISGSDLALSENTQALKKMGAKIFIGEQKAENLAKDCNLVIYSPAVKSDNPELKKAKKLNIKVQSYPQALGDLTKKYFTITVSGTHGKSTTTAMLGLLLKNAGLDPTVIVGTKLKEFGNSNCRVGKSKYLVIEADEWQASFLNYWPKIAVITNIEKEHLDCYKNLNHILKTYKEYVGHLPKNGVLVANKDDKNVQKIKSSSKRQTYSLKQKEADKLKKILKVPGKHNIYNSLATLTVARILKIPDKTSFKALSEYRGSWRRFEILKSSKKMTIVSDYAHHPTEVKMTLKAVREKFPKKEIWCVFQPHQYQRTFYLFDNFVKAFKENPIDKLIIADIYDVAGREEKGIKKKVSSEKLIKAINEPWAVYLKKEKIVKYLKKNILNGRKTVLIIMGAGDIYKLVYSF